MYKKILVVILCVFLIGFSVGEVFSEKKTYSEKENRYLTSWPEFTVSRLLNGKYVSEVEDYLNDHFLLRDKWISLNSLFGMLTLKSEINGIYLGSEQYLIEKYNKIEKPRLIYESINEFVKANSEVKIEVMLVPTSIVINEDKLPANVVVDDQYADLKLINSALDCYSYDLKEVLVKANEIDDVYYRLDHHWTTYGAYQAYKQFCLNNDIAYHEIGDYSIKLVSNTFTGTIYSKTGDLGYQKDEIEIYRLPNSDYTIAYNDVVVDSFYDESYLSVNDQYAYFLSGNHPLVTIVNNNCDNQQHLLIIKDSYANAFVPLIAEHYQYVSLIDPRYYGKNIKEYIEENNVTQVLFLYNMNTIGNDVGIRGIE